MISKKGKNENDYNTERQQTAEHPSNGMEWLAGNSARWAAIIIVIIMEKLPATHKKISEKLPWFWRKHTAHRFDVAPSLSIASPTMAIILYSDQEIHPTRPLSNSEILSIQRRIVRANALKAICFSIFCFDPEQFTFSHGHLINTFNWMAHTMCVVCVYESECLCLISTAAQRHPVQLAGSRFFFTQMCGKSD